MCVCVCILKKKTGILHFSYISIFTVFFDKINVALVNIRDNFKKKLNY